MSGSHPREDADVLRAEVLTLRNRTAELERQVTDWKKRGGQVR